MLKEKSFLFMLFVIIVFFVGCANPQLLNNVNEQQQSETNVGVTLSKYKNIQENTTKKLVNTYQEYYNEIVKNTASKEVQNDPNKQPKTDKSFIGKASRSNSNYYITLEELAKIMPNGDTMEFNRNYDPRGNLSNDNTNDIVTITNEQMNQIKDMNTKIVNVIDDYKNQIEINKPDIKSLSDTYDYIKVSSDGNQIIMGGDMIIDVRSFQGAAIAEVLIAQANGASIEDIENNLLKLGISIKEDDTNNTRGHYIKDTPTWCNGTIYYNDDGVVTEKYKNEIREAMKDWENRTGFIKFIYWKDYSVFSFNGPYYTGNRLNIYEKDISAPAESTVGYSTAWNGAQFNIDSKGNEISYSNSNWRRQAFRHELGHVIGLQHEHQRWDRDDYVQYTGNIPNDPNIAKMNHYNGTIFDRFDTRWEQIGSWDRWYISGWKWVGGEWWQGGHWEANWSCEKIPICGWVTYMVYKNKVYSETPTGYDARSIMSYAGNFRTKVAVSGLPANHILTVEDCMNITGSDVETVKKLYGR